jgi:hypothetical protein
MADLGASWDLLREGGCIIADDFDPSWASVVQAVNDFAKSKQTKVIDRRPKAILRKA